MNLTFQIQVTGDSNKEIGKFVRQIAFGIEAEMKIAMTGPKSGNVYIRRGRSHQASAPGEAPAVDTGFLINSIQTDARETEATITIGAEYAEGLEFGTDDIAARPFVQPAIDSVLKRFDGGGFLAGAGE